MEAWLRPLFDAAGMRAVDSWAIEEQGTPSLELMEAAGAAVAEAAREVAGTGVARVVCGKGNNGGDGLVAARHLAETGYEVEALLLWPADELSPDAAANLARFGGRIAEVGAREVADALAGLGRGRRRDLRNRLFGRTAGPGRRRDRGDQRLRGAGRRGRHRLRRRRLHRRGRGRRRGGAALTVGFHAAKLGHWVAPGKARTGELRVVEIGIPGDPPSEPVGRADRRRGPRRWRRGASPNSNKFDSGEVVVVGGSRGLTGAVCMASEAAIRVGAGYATVAVPADLEPIFEVKLTEVMSRGFAGGEGRLASASADGDPRGDAPRGGGRPRAGAGARRRLARAGEGGGARRRRRLCSWTPTA